MSFEAILAKWLRAVINGGLRKQVLAAIPVDTGRLRKSLVFRVRGGASPAIVVELEDYSRYVKARGRPDDRLWFVVRQLVYAATVFAVGRALEEYLGSIFR